MTAAVHQALRRPTAALAAAALLAVAWRVPFARLPITTDEAGYVTVARLWAHGAQLYRGAWVDRPQGLVLVYRLVAWTGGSLASLRLAAVVAGVVLVVLVGLAGAALDGRRTGVAAALIAGALGCSPFLESFALTGELLAALPAVACAVCGARWLSTRQLRWLVGAGLLWGCAILVKQSAFDGGIAVAAAVAWSRPRSRPLLVFAAATALPVVVAVLTAPSARDWWFAVVAYRFHGEGVVAGVSSIRAADVEALALPLLKGLGPLLAVGLYGLRASPRFVRVWAAAAAVGALGGGLFHAHYFIELVPPLAVASAYGLTRRSLAAPLLAAACLVSVAATVPAIDVPLRREVALIFPRDPHLASDASVARVVAASTHALSPILVLPPTASIGYLADRPSAIPYLWARNVETIPAATRAERDAILERRAATLVVEHEPGFLRAVGLSLRTIRRYYSPVATTGGTTVYRPLAGGDGAVRLPRALRPRPR